MERGTRQQGDGAPANGSTEQGNRAGGDHHRGYGGISTRSSIGALRLTSGRLRLSLCHHHSLAIPHRNAVSRVLCCDTSPPPPFLASPATPPAMFFPTIDPKQAKLLRQIDYYFSTENLCKDTYLRENMDDQGWVPLSLIANFNRVRQLTDDIQFVMETVQLSSAVELQGDKIRRRYDWRNWLLPQPNNLSGTDLGLSSPSTSSVDNIVVRLQAAELEGETNHTIGI
uniref:HTH La-type RNA-binding domain-containing protein n=1 Tax=Ananas comosus var. bracteatus TaxID=296719 RepID=A0A6V7NK66_ANACO|nr:unnamed protein product [Ananas comosus var. bracteatus]